ncbi:MAG: 30S ribosomal protein S6e [Candidatus Bathyarchaeota archaeon]|nr:MAG: 30S ribosomal protein S6e [Candidatus Bathyarchaeota archaeon]
MAKFKIVLSDPETGTSQIVELEGSRAVPLVGRHLGEIIDGTALGLGGHKLKITGGSDKDGFPMRPDIQGGVKTRVILSKGVGIHPTVEGQRRRKTLRGRVITEEILQVNMKIVEKPKQTKKSRSTKTKPKKGTAEKPEEAGAQTNPSQDVTETAVTDASEETGETRPPSAEK